MDILDAIGNTSLVRLRRVVPANCAEVWVKLEWENPTGSLKDRMARAVIERAEADGRLQPGDTVVEYTGGSTGASLALVCAAKGYRIRIVSSDAFSPEKLDQMAALGAELTLVPSEGGLTTKKLILEMIETARRLSREPRTYWIDQLDNHDSIAGYFPPGEEIWSQTAGKVGAFVHCAGTAASSRGVATVLKRHRPEIQIVVVEPAESAVLLGGPAGPHKIEGVGIGYTPPLWEPSLVDEIMAVSTADAKAMARRRGRAARGRAPGARGPGGHADDRLRAEVPEHRRLPEPLKPARARTALMGAPGTTCVYQEIPRGGTPMNRFGLVALLVPALAVATAAAPAWGAGQQPAPVVVTNFPPTQQVAGTVAVGGPIPSTRLESHGALVSPALPADLNSLTDGGVLDASGFVSATFSLAAAVQGSLGSPGKVGALLVPDVAEILSVMRNSGVVQFPIAIEAPVSPSATGIHQGVPVTVRLGFSRYRVFFYNTTPRSSQLTLYSYLGTS